MNAKLFDDPSISEFTMALMGACSVNTTKTTSWGKKGVSMIDYRTDGILCATFSKRVGSGDASHIAGGLEGKNDVARQGRAGDAAVAAGNQGGLSGSSALSLGGGIYSGTVSPDKANRAASQRRTLEMRVEQARMDAFMSCFVEHGYKEFELTSEQRAELAKLPQGSDQCRKYRYKRGTDPNNLKAASSAKQPGRAWR